jgi:hypothetical protein
MLSWQSLVRQNRDAIISSEPVRISSHRLSWVLAISSFPLLLAMIPLHQTLGDATTVIYLVSLCGGVAWQQWRAVVRQRTARERANRERQKADVVAGV